VVATLERQNQSLRAGVATDSSSRGGGANGRRGGGGGGGGSRPAERAAVQRLSTRLAEAEQRAAKSLARVQVIIHSIISIAAEAAASRAAASQPASQRRPRQPHCRRAPPALPCNPSPLPPQRGWPRGVCRGMTPRARQELMAREAELLEESNSWQSKLERAEVMQQRAEREVERLQRELAQAARQPPHLRR
jgi:hypothetical protein